MEKIKLLLVEDNNFYRSVIKDSLEMTGEYFVLEAKNGLEGYEVFKSSDFDIIVTDVDMPKISGLEMVDLIRKEDENIPILVASALVNSENIIEAFEHDIDNYIKKPFAVEELDSIIKALFKRIMKNNQIITPKNKTTHLGSFFFDTENRCLIRKGISVSLSKREAQILYMLYSNKGKQVKRSEILKEFWGSEDDPYHSRSLDVFIAKLRKFLKADASISINTIRSEGLILDF